jgi:hypothetical protein
VDIPLSQGGLDTTKQELEKKLIYALKLAHCDFVFDLPL